MADTNALKAQMATIVELRELDCKINETKKANSEILDEAERKMIEMLEESGLANFRSDLGLVSVSHRKSVQTPKTPEDWALLFDYIKNKGLDAPGVMISVNSQKLNSFFRDEFELAAAAGKDDFNLPGCPNVSITPVLSFRKA